MKRPTISQYSVTVANARGFARTLGEMEAETDPYGNVRLTSGNNAAVFRVRHDGAPLAIKCYTKPGLPERRIYSFIADNPDHLLVPARILDNELFVYDDSGNAAYADVVVYPWTEGNSLRVEIKRAVRETGKPRLRELSVIFENAARHMLAQPWAHGDLKPENIIIKPDDSICLIDYDAMYVPTLSGEKATELGTPGFRHPARTEHHYNASLDDYTIALIAVSLRALALDPGLYETYNRSDNILLYPEEIIAGTSEAYGSILSLLAKEGDRTGYELALLLLSPDPELPTLARILGNASGEKPCEDGLHMFECCGLWGYKDGSGRVVMEAIYDEATDFSEGFAVVKLNGIPQVITEQGHALVSGEYSAIKPFSEGLAAVELNNRWGYINTDGELAIAPQFDIAGSMHEGRAAIKTGEKWGYIDHKGSLVIEPVYDHAAGFRNGKAMVCIGDEIFYLDRF